MAVYTQHRLYREHSAQWERCRDAYEGSDAIKKKGPAYLPLLEGHTASNSLGYIGYLNRALFYPATGRTVNGLTGLVFAKPPTAAGVPEIRRKEFDDVTLMGTPLAQFGMTLTQETLITGRVGLLIDMPEQPEQNARPYWLYYRAEQVINWRVTRINGVQVLTMVVLLEDIEEAGDDQFDVKVVRQYRVLELNGGKYTVTIWKESTDSAKKGQWFAGETRTPLRRGLPLPFIPFLFLNATGIEVEVMDPPLLAMVDVNLSHYRTSADHEHGAHFTALPTPYVTGHEMKQGESLSIGSGNAWVLPNAQSTAGMLEFSGSGLGALQTLKDDKRQLMITLGARMLETQPATNEAYATVRLRHGGESSAMSILAESVGRALTQGVRWHLWWVGGYEMTALDKTTVTMNPEVMDELSASDAQILVKMWQENAISKKTLHYNLEWGEWTRPGITFEEEEAEIKKEKPDPPPATPPIRLIERDADGRPARIIG